MLLQRLWARICRRWRAVQCGGPSCALFKGPCPCPCKPSAADSARLEDDKSRAVRCETDPLPYKAYQPTRQRTERKLPVNYWFYVYLYSNDCERLLRPFRELKREDSPSDRRLLSIMNRCKVCIYLQGSMELYKSLPRYILVVRGVNWDSVVRAVVELEDSFPQVMKFASHPLLMDTSTCRFSCTGFHQTALQTRVTRPRNETVR